MNIMKLVAAGFMTATVFFACTSASVEKDPELEKIGQRGKVEEFEEGIMENIKTITIKASVADAEGGQKAAELKLIPYYAWNNRGDYTKMNVWFGRDAETALCD